MDYELIESYQEVVENVRQFNQDLATGKDICSQLSQFIAWYYIPELDALRSSKFIGYKGRNTSRYQRGDEKDGRETERRLQKFFRPIDESHHLYAYLENKLLIITAQCGKKPNKQSRLNVPRGFK